MPSATRQPARTHYRPREIAEARDVKVDIVLTWINDGQLAAVDCSRKRGGRPRWRISANALAEFDAKRASTPGPMIQRIRRRRDPAVIEFF